MMVSIACAFLVSSWYLSLRAGSRFWLCGGPLGPARRAGPGGAGQRSGPASGGSGLLGAPRPPGCRGWVVPQDAADRCAATVRALLWRCCCRSGCLEEGAYRAAAGLRCRLGAGPGRLLPSGCSSSGTTPGLGVRRPGSPPGCGRAAGHRRVRFHAGLAGRGRGCCVTGWAGMGPARRLWLEGRRGPGG